MSKTIDEMDAMLDAMGVEHTVLGPVIRVSGTPSVMNVRDMYNGRVVVEFARQFRPKEAIDMIVRAMDVM